MNIKTKEKRQMLAAKSNVIKKLVKVGAFESVNHGLISEYQQETGASEFNTFNQWKKLGFFVKKGERSFPVWGSPVKSKIDKCASENETLNEFSFFPICNLFHDGQVVSKEINN